MNFVSPYFQTVRIQPLIILAATLALSIGTFSVAMGQVVGGKGATIKDPPPSVSAPTRTTKGTVRIITKYVPKPVTPTTGRLFVSAEPNAVLLVEPKKVRNGVAQQGTVTAGRRDFIFNDLNPGLYRVAGTLPGYHEAETEIAIKANKSESVTLNFLPILYTVTIKTNVSAGELMYGKEGQPLSNVVPIQNKSVQLELPAGTYDVGIRSGEFGYETLRKSFSLTGDQTVLDMPLRRIVMTTDTLSPSWTNAELQTWDMPAAWRPDSRKNLTVKGSGVALPREEAYRYYQNFKLSSSARMLNGVALSFALRAQDSQNYYLLQVSGEKSDEPYTVRLFVVKKGVEQRIRAIPISRLGAKAMGSGQFFAVSIKMIDFAITVEIEDSETGAPYTLGVLTDPAKTFPVGAVGIAGHANEENVIGRFVVCTGDKCLSE